MPLISSSIGLSNWPGFLSRTNSSTCAVEPFADFADAEMPIEFGDEIGEPDRVGVEHGDIAGGLIGDMHFVPLIDQAEQRAAHRDHVVIGMGREDHDPLGKDRVGAAADVAGRLRGSGLPPGQPVIVSCIARNTSTLMS